MSKKDKKEQVMHPTCMSVLSSVDDALYVIGGKWKMRVLTTLLKTDNRRFNELQRTINGISARVLSTELKDLELNGFVKRKVYTDQTPVIVEYEPTDYGKTVQPIIKALSDWGIKHKKKIKSER
jgi:DNA-binding HxlR family transcriptional regulator